jgi:arginine decarboxylase
MDTVPVKKTVNRVKASLDKRKGPARKEQDAAPIADAIRDYWDRGMLTFGIPAHNGGRGPAPDVASLIGLDAVRCDLPMSHGVDTRDRSWQVQTTAQELFAEAVGAKQTLFSTNGSSLSVHVAIMTVCGPGDTLVMARNGHKSAFAGLVLSGARPV